MTEKTNFVIKKCFFSRYIMISKMAKPEEVLVAENDQGELVREFMKVITPTSPSVDFIF